MRKAIILAALYALISFQLEAQNSTNKELTTNGAWCWFSDPRAIYTDERNIVVTGWVKDDGTIEAASLDLNSNEIRTSVLFPNMEYDDHNNPAFVLLPDNNILAMYTWHSSKRGVVYNITTVPGDIQSFGAAIVFKPK